MKALFEPVLSMAGMEELNKLWNKDTGANVLFNGCIDSQKVHVSSAIASKIGYQVIVTSDEVKARQIAEDATFFNENVCFYPAKDVIFYSADTHGSQIVGERLRCINRILNCKKGDQLTVVTTIDALADRIIEIEKYVDYVINVKVGTVIEVESFSKKMVELGYERTGMVEAPGQFAIRGGIIDIFSHTEETPVRIELWDDEVDSIRSFDAESQRSIEKLDEFEIFPATECLLTEEEKENGLEKIEEAVNVQLEKFGINEKKRSKESIESCNHLKRIYADAQRTGDFEKFISYFDSDLVSFISYFPKDNTIFTLDEPNRLVERMEFVSYEYEESMKNRLQAGYVLPGQTNQFGDIKEIYHTLEDYKLLALESLDYKPKGLKIDYSMRVDARSINSYNNSFETLCEDIKRYRKNKYKIVLCCNSRTRAKRIVEDLETFDIPCFYSEDYEEILKESQVMVTYGNIHKGFEYSLAGFVFIAENDIFTQKKVKKVKKHNYDGKAIASFNDLNVGDYVVHESHGLGIYKGIEKIKVEGTEKDYVKIEYAGNSNLYVLATQLDRLQKYAASDVEKKPKLNKLGGVEWNKTRARVHSAVEEVAKELVDLYAIRQQQKGYCFGRDTVWQTEFEEMFPYEETKDQLDAIEDTKRDMESTKIMDRLICGDVGYGKTEIAIRAAFKAVQEGKQVAYLVPTTVLASQHFNTFVERMKNFPITIVQVSSFRTAKENKESLSEIKKGMVDIAIGTHRLLSKDVEFKDLGLLIIDEEQRFGVTHKEKIKQLKNNIDVLTLTATPIPRTLHMSLVGIRDMSVLEEPPVDRIPIQTFVTDHNDEMIREAIKRELSRGGQVYYVYNKVKNIAEVTAYVQNLVPDANVVFAHGQMDKRQLENIMYDFINGEIDVLVSTTIIETGMDISNCNTMIIEDADKFGLSQLYQLRGRVGRSSRTAYAFLLYRRDRLISEVAEKRLSAIREFSDFGSGFKIAMKDLEIRGAGSVLGKSQHGHMAAVGYDLYCKMLQESVNSLKGVKNEYAFETTVDLEVDAYIPANYIKSEYQKLEIYKRIASIDTEEEMSDMKDELMDRYGKLPNCANNLLMIALIKSMAHKIGIMEIKGAVYMTETPSMWKTKMTVYGKADINPDRLSELLDKYQNTLSIAAGTIPAFLWRVTKKKYGNDKEYLQGLLDLMKIMIELLLT